MDFIQESLERFRGMHAAIRKNLSIPPLSDTDRYTDFFREYRDKFAGANSDHVESWMAIYYTYERWSAYKTIYKIDPLFLNMLTRTDDTPIHTELFARLPFPAFYVSSQTESGADLGFIVTFERQPDASYDLILTCIDDKMDTELVIRCFNLNIRNGQTISEAILNTHPDETDAPLTGHIMTAILTAYYLVSLNPDIRQIKIPKNKRPTTQNGTRLNFRKWDVGFREGASIERMMKQTESEPTGRTVHRTHKNRPHVRRAHWHHYWTGKGRTELVVRWLAPMVINENAESGAPIPTIHRSEPVSEENTDNG